MIMGSGKSYNFYGSWRDGKTSDKNSVQVVLRARVVDDVTGSPCPSTCELRGLQTQKLQNPRAEEDRCLHCRETMNLHFLYLFLQIGLQQISYSPYW
jgi:hypothetical protein